MSDIEPLSISGDEGHARIGQGEIPRTADEPLSDSRRGPRFEPCPACAGTGLRAVPPAPKAKGGAPGRAGRSHGYQATYAAGCRCELCRAAWREAARRRKAGR